MRICFLFCCKQKTAYDMRISDWSSDVCSSDLGVRLEWLKEVVDYIAGYFDLPNLNVPEFKVDTLEAVGQGELEEIATEIRARWDIRPGQMPDVIRQLEITGIMVSRHQDRKCVV